MPTLRAHPAVEPAQVIPALRALPRLGAAVGVPEGDGGEGDEQSLKQRIESKEAYRPVDEPTVGSGGSGFATSDEEIARYEARLAAARARDRRPHDA